MVRLLQIGVVFAVVAALIAVLDFVMNPSGSPVRTTLRTVRDAAAAQYARVSGQPEPTSPETPPVPAPAAASPAGRRAAPASAAAPGANPAVPSTTGGMPSAAAPARSGAPAAPVGPPPPATTPVPSRGDFYLPGRMGSWIGYNVKIASPIVIRAGGRVVAGNDASGPNGLSTSSFQRTLDARQPGPDQNVRVMPTAPYLALIGRVCSGEICSDPFVVGSNRVLCPGDLGIRGGTLQLWTNNYVVVDGMQTSLTYSSVFGGYSFYVEPAPESLCQPGARRAASSASSLDAKALSAGQTLRNPEFVISSSQSSWKPFFLPLSMPLVIRASGTMQPRGGAEPTGPRGIVVPAAAQWSYPGARDVTVDSTHRLFDPSLPYQSLIGRLCAADSCGQPFLVGTERIVCPDPRFADRLELWINHIISPAGLLGSQTPLSLDAFDLQTRSGQYRFEVSRATAGACLH